MAPLPYVYAVNLVYAVNMPHDANGVNMRQDGPVNERRRAYHHGDLANALTNAATELARHGGPEAVVLREAARQVGVSATAAYRHFASHGDLVHEVKERGRASVRACMRTGADGGSPPRCP